MSKTRLTTSFSQVLKKIGIINNELYELFIKTKRIGKSDLFIRATKGKGRGVFAGRNFEANECIEISPIIRIPEDECGYVEGTTVSNYWYDNDNDGIIALGFGSLFNHSYNPNADYIMRHAMSGVVFFFSRRKIRKGSEVTINYNGDPYDQTKMVFEVDSKTEKQRIIDTSLHLEYPTLAETYCGLDTFTFEGDDEIRIAKLVSSVTCDSCKTWIFKLKSQLKVLE